MTKIKNACIFCNGILFDAGFTRRVAGQSDLVIAANGGLSNLLKIGMKPDIVIGDMDSTSLNRWVNEKQIEFITYRVEKDKTDTELAIELAIEGMHGGRKVDYISGAGNSSKRVDAMEAKAIKGAFPSDYQALPISSIKSMLGESISSGGMRMAANALILGEGFIPPTIHYQTPDPHCDLNYVSNSSVERTMKTILHNAISPDGTYASIILGK